MQAATVKGFVSTRGMNNVMYALMVLALPPITLFLVSSVLFGGGALFEPLKIVAPTAVTVTVFLGWLLFQAALMRFLPGRVVQGMPRKDGTTLPYRINGLLALCITLALAVGLSFANVI